MQVVGALFETVVITVNSSIALTSARRVLAKMSSDGQG